MTHVLCGGVENVPEVAITFQLDKKTIRSIHGHQPLGTNTCG